MSAVTQAKIEKLLDGFIIPSNDSCLMQNERILTALVLYTRLDSATTNTTTTTTVDDIENFWRSHAAVLVPWMQNLIQTSIPSNDDDDDDNDDNLATAGATTVSSKRRRFDEIYERLVAQVLISVTNTCDTVPDYIKGTVIEPLGSALMKVWTSHHVNKKYDDDDRTSSMKLLYDSDLLAGLTAWLTIREGDEEKWAENDIALRQIIERLVVNDDENKPKELKEASIDSLEDVSQQASEQATSPKTLMLQTLSALLNQNSPLPPQSENPCSLTDCVEQMGLSTLFCQHCQHAPKNSSIPSFFRPLLDWWVIQEASSRRYGNAARDRSVWAQVLLLSTLELAEKNRKLLQPSELSLLTKVLLACVVSISPTATTNSSSSTSATSEELRMIAWTTGASLIDLYGWDFWLVGSSSSNDTTHNKNRPMGQASQLCAWLRLAAGEWKIQLGWFLTDARNDMSDGNNNIDSSSLESDRIRIVQACAHILVQGLQYMTQMADRMDDGDDDRDCNLPVLSADAILHIQKTLQETLHSAVQYLGEPRLPIQRSPDNDTVTDSVIFVLGNLLSEMDVFASIPCSRDTLNENEILQALASALKFNSRIAVQEYLLPGLTTVFASSEGDKARMQLLKEYGLTGASLGEYLEAYFRRTINLESLAWACQLVDLWTSIVPVDASGSLLDSVLSCLQRLLAIHEGREKLGKALSSAVACYVTLKDDEPPNDRDSQIIQHAMEMSSRLTG